MYIYIAAFLGSLSSYISLPIFSTSVVLKFIVVVDLKGSFSGIYHLTVQYCIRKLHNVSGS